ncbi:MAG TPA: hypothetical protein VFN19_05000 [Candidatus Nanopelagicales bacterium]|nr:hypothetical protein [Candidatus Nanopelagicales bacterium]
MPVTTTPPMLRAGLLALRCGTTSWQLGLDPAHAVLLRGVDAGCARGLQALDRRHYPHADPADVALLGTALLAQLDRLGLLASGRTSVAARPGSARTRARRQGELVAAAVLHREDPLPRRRRQRVAVCGSGPVPALLAAGLAQAGVGTVAVLGRGRPVVACDLTVAGPRAGDLGRPWNEAVADVVRELGAQTTLVGGRPHVAVLTDTVDADLPWCDPQHGDEWLRRGVPHLPVIAAGGGAQVGPLVLPGRTACLHCEELALVERDRHRPALTLGLRELARSGARAGLPVAASLAALAASHGVVRTLEVLDGVAEPTGTRLLLRLPDASADVDPIAPHPTCGCRWGEGGRTMGPWTTFPGAR